MIVLAANVVPLPATNSDLITHLGLGGIFAVIVIREVLNFLRARPVGQGGSDNASITRRELHELSTTCQSKASKEEVRTLAGAVQYRSQCQEVVKRLDERFEHLNELEKQRTSHIEHQFNEVKHMIRKYGNGKTD
jgi:hypothetical protein